MILAALIQFAGAYPAHGVTGTWLDEILELGVPPVPFTARFLQDPTPNDPATKAAGRALYQTNCAVCHGPRGLGDGPAAFTLVPRPFNLQVHVPQHAPGELFYWISDGVASTAMPAWGAVDETTGKPKLSDPERWEIIRYLQGLAAGEYPQ